MTPLIGPGKWVLIDFWATWCGPCRGELPYLKEAFKEFGPKGFNIYGVSLDNDAESWKEFLVKEEMTWPNVIAVTDGKSAPIVEEYGIRSIRPTSISPEGKIVAKTCEAKESRRSSPNWSNKRHPAKSSNYPCGFQPAGVIFCMTKSPVPIASRTRQMPSFPATIFPPTNSGKESEQSTDYLKSNIINVLYSKLPLLPRYKIKRLVNFTTNYLHKSNFHTTFAFAIRRRSLIE